MKPILSLMIALFLFDKIGCGQAIPYVPHQIGAYISSDGTGALGTWAPLQGNGTATIPFVPQAYGIYVSNDGTGNVGTWVPWTGEGTGGGISSVTGTSPIVAVTNDGAVTVSCPTCGTGGGSIPSTTNLISGNGSGDGADSGIVPTNVATLSGAQTLTGAKTFSAAGAASTSEVSGTGAVFTGGSTTTNVPLWYINQGTAPSTWNALGTEFGINAPSGFGGSFLDFHLNGGASALSVSATGRLVDTGGAQLSRSTADTVVTLAVANGNASSTGATITTTNAGSGDQADFGSNTHIANNGTVTLPQLVGGGSAPTIAVGSGAGTGATVSITGTNMAGVITLNSGTTTTIATLWTVTFNGTLASAPIGCHLQARNANGVFNSTVVITDAPTTTTWVAEAAGAVGESVTMQWSYLCI